MRGVCAYSVLVILAEPRCLVDVLKNSARLSMSGHLCAMSVKCANASKNDLLKALVIHKRRNIIMALPKERWISPEEYLDIDRASADVKYEYMDGQMYAMAGGTFNHAEIALNLIMSLREHLGNGPCRASSSDVRVQVAERKYYYPDATVSCNPEDWQQGTNDIVRTPRLVVEVLSPSTEKRDRGEKLRAYQKCPSIEEYVLIRTEYQDVEIFNRDGHFWTYRQFGPGEDVELRSIDLTIPIAALYRRTDVPEPEAD
jgi:Uma2 family endonuclease